ARGARRVPARAGGGAAAGGGVGGGSPAGGAPAGGRGVATLVQEGPADQDLLAGADVGQRAVDADLVAGDAEAAHVVVGHGAGPAGQGDRSHRLEVQGDPQLGAVGQVDVVDLDRQDAEAAAAAELRLVRGGLPTGDLAVERGAAERLGQRPAGLAA